MPIPSLPLDQLRAQRDAALAKLEASKARTSWPVYPTLSADEVQREYRRQTRLLGAYKKLLPALSVARCPLSGGRVLLPMDPFGFDGPWWAPREITRYPAARGSAQLRVVLGAVDLHGRAPIEAASQALVLPGPGAPFVVPALLAQEGMQAVLAQLTLETGDTAYVTSYYSPAPLHGARLHQPWGRASYQVRSASGRVLGWTTKNEPWDFELQPWVDAGRLSWIAPGDDSATLVSAGPCPYVGLGGVRRPQEIVRGTLHLRPLPDGRRPEPFE
ncbi:MAG: hypothetical protein H6741_13050 [Alphaproteobacteria bacterium]|nr:hypothetical protein [Alphaproteobacteria bacterium]